MAKAAEDSHAHPLRALCDQWLAKIDASLRVRDERFGQYACEAEKFFDGNHNFMWDKEYSTGNGGFLDKAGGTLPTFRITVNKLFEAVALYGPSLYHQNPEVLVTPRQPPEVPPEALGIDQQDPWGMQVYAELAMQERLQQVVKKACAEVKQRYLNWLQYETDKKKQSRRAITEGVVCGLGLLYTEMYQPPFSKIKMPRSRYLSWHDYTVDPDADYYEDAQWIAVRHVHAVNKVEQRFGLTPGSLKGHMQSIDSQSTRRAKKEVNSNRPDKSFDLIEYWEIFSKNGFGHRLNTAKDLPASQTYNFDAFGDYCYIVVAKGIPFPLNMPTELLRHPETTPEDLFERSQWPIPFWYDASSDGGWPVTRLMFYDKPKAIWPVGIFKPAIGELRFVNWCLSFLADKVAASCTTYVGVLKAAGVEIQKQLAGKNSPFTVLEISEVLNKANINEVVSFLNAPNFSSDIWKMLAEVLELIDRRTGLTELIYGQTGTSMRSATEAQVKNQNLAIRPDDMAQSVESWLSETAVREMQAAHWFCEPQDVLPVVGQMGAMVWQKYIMEADVDAVVRDYDYRIEAGSARKPNKATKVAQLVEFGQYALPVLQQFASAGMVEPWNAFMRDYGKASDLDVSGYLLDPAMFQQQGASAEDQAAQAEMELKIAELQLKQQEMMAKLQFQAEEHSQEMDHSEEEHKLRMEQMRAEMKVKEAKAKVDAQIAKQRAKAQATAAKTNAKPGAKK